MCIFSQILIVQYYRQHSKHTNLWTENLHLCNSL